MLDETSLFEEETLSMIEAMRRQERKYACDDYCRLHKDKTNATTLVSDRKLMLKWMSNVVDYFSLSRESVAIAMAYSDRFLQSEQGPEFLEDTDKYQLLCIVCLYLACKVHETASLAPKVFVEIGRGHFNTDHVEALEKKVLKTLDWQVNPPTALGFVRLFLDTIPQSVLDDSMKATAYMLSRAQTERAVGDYKLVTMEPSKIAIASLQNSLGVLGYRDGSAFLKKAPVMEAAISQDEMKALRVRISGAISMQTSRTNLLSYGASADRATASSSKTKTSNRAPENTTPRSVLCHMFAD